MNTIITIGREFGSGGRELGHRLAKELNIPYYDKEILTAIAKDTSLSEGYIQHVTEQVPTATIPITIGQTFTYFQEFPFQRAQDVYQSQSRILKELAEKSSCVIVGRCADYLLADQKPIRLFVCAELESRIRRTAERSTTAEHLSEKELRKRILEIDKKRAKFYEYYTDQKWGDRLNYDMTINTTDMDIGKIVPYLAKIFE